MSTDANQRLRTSVVIPFYNGSQQIERCLRAVTQQTVLPSQVIIVDDCSLPEERAFVEQILSKFRELNISLVSGEGAGQSAARNLGAYLSNSDALFFLDQDDFWYPEHLERTLDVLQNGADFVYSDVDRMFLLWGRQYLVRRYGSIVAEQPKRTLKGLFGENFHVLPSVMAFRKEAFESLGGFDKLLRGFEDDDIVHRALDAGLDIRFLAVSGAIWFETPGSASVSPQMISSRLRYAELALGRASKLSKADQGRAKRLIFWKFIPHALLNHSSSQELLMLLMSNKFHEARFRSKPRSREWILSRVSNFAIRANAMLQIVSHLHTNMTKLSLIIITRANQNKVDLDERSVHTH